MEKYSIDDSRVEDLIRRGIPRGLAVELVAAGKYEETISHTEPVFQQNNLSTQAQPSKPEITGE